MAVPIKNGAPFRPFLPPARAPAPQDESESLKPHSGSHKDEIKSEEGRERERGRGRGGQGFLSLREREVCQNCRRKVSRRPLFRSCAPLKKWRFLSKTTEPGIMYLLPPAGFFFARYCLGLSSGERERRMGRE